MIRVSGTGGGAPAAASRRTAKPPDVFRLDAGAKATGGPAQGAAPAPVETLGALIALQSGEGGARRSREQVIAAAQRALDMLDRIRRGVLDGAVPNEDLDALAQAASSAANGPDVDAGLAALYDDIALRARVELAKRGR